MARVNLGRVLGRSAYEEAVRLGYVGDEAQWIASLKGDSAYKIAQNNGFTGTQTEWLQSLNGTTAYEAAVAGGYTGNEESFNQYIAALGNLNSILDSINGEVV